jgi:hypothetical protein
MIFSPVSTGSSGHALGATAPVHVENFPWSDSELAHDEIWKLLEIKKLNEMQSRILTAIGWIGKAIRDEDRVRSFVQYIFALESLLTLQQKDNIVNASITSQISEFAAFILGTDYETRVRIQDLVKALYRLRSKVVHGVGGEVMQEDIIHALVLLKNLVSTLLLHPELSQFTKMVELNEWVKRIKYN